MIHEKNPESATSETTARECCRDLGANPDRWWGRVNNYILDGYHEGQDDARRELARLRSDNKAIRAGAIRAGETIAELRARVAELEAALDADGCADCDECGEVA